MGSHGSTDTSEWVLLVMVTQVCRLSRTLGLQGRLLCQIFAMRLAGVKLVLNTCYYLLGYLMGNPGRGVNVTKYFYTLRYHLQLMVCNTGAFEGVL